MHKHLHHFFVAVGTIAFIVVIWFLWLLFNFYHSSLVSGKQTIDYTLSHGASSHQVAHQLQKQNIIKHPKFFVFMSRLKGEARHLKAGGYALTPGITANQLLYNLAHGKVAIEDLTIIEGWSFKDMLRVINNDKHIKHTLKGLTARQISNKLGIKYPNPEGWFFPDTYHFPWNTTDISILLKAHKLMQKHLAKQWQTRAKHLWYRNPYQALIVASMIVKEAQIAAERPMIAGVILRRLKKGIKLQIDPTVIYGMGERYKGKITTRDLLKKTPYNTYRKYGLPPTPIAMPGEASIYAALHPVNGKYLYFVAKGDGSHVFSKTLKQHDAAIRKYILHKG